MKRLIKNQFNMKIDYIQARTKKASQQRSYSIHCNELLWKEDFPKEVLSYGGNLARSRRLPALGVMIFIPLLYGNFYLSSIKKFIMSLEKDWSICFYNK